MQKQKSDKKNKKRVLFTVCIILIICIAFVVVFFLMGEFSQETKIYEAQIKNESQALTEKLVSEIQNVDTSDQGLNDQQTAVEQPGEVPAEVITEAEKQVIAAELAKLEDERKQRVLMTLSAAYSKALDEQKQEAFNMVENLIAQGKADWAALVAKGENTAINKGLLASEYLAKSQVMEEQMDTGFYALVSKMEEQLKAEGIDPTEIIAKYKSEYELIKEENKNTLMEKVMAAVKK